MKSFHPNPQPSVSGWSEAVWVGRGGVGWGGVGRAVRSAVEWSVEWSEMEVAGRCGGQAEFW